MTHHYLKKSNKYDSIIFQFNTNTFIKFQSMKSLVIFFLGNEKESKTIKIMYRHKKLFITPDSFKSSIRYSTNQKHKIQYVMKYSITGGKLPYEERDLKSVGRIYGNRIHKTCHVNIVFFNK